MLSAAFTLIRTTRATLMSFEVVEVVLWRYSMIEDGTILTRPKTEIDWSLDGLDGTQKAVDIFRDVETSS